jgi:tetratricopeptide (TPR) repeat protein
MIRFVAWVLVGLAVVGCGGSAPPVEHPQGPPQVVAMDELHITAERNQTGDYDFQVYDAAELFTRATDLLNRDRCADAAALYNAGLCLQQTQQLDAARDHYQRLRERVPGSPDIKDATFQLAAVLVDLERFQDGVAIADELLTRADLSTDERLEALTRRAQALLGAGQIEDADRQARSALSFFRTRPAEESIRDDFFAAASNYVLAETIRLKAQAIAFPVGSIEEQKAVLIRRAELLLEAQREYFNTIHFSNVRWTAASGYRIGNMYDELWHSIMSAPVPPHLPPEGHPIYRQELAKLIKPLIRHAIRYWEVTLLLLERTGFQSEWTAQTRVDLDRVRKLLLEQPEGPGGLSAPGPSSAPSGAAEPPPASAPSGSE